MSKLKILLIATALGLMFLISEGLYVYNNEPLFLQYSFQVTRFLASIGKTKLSFYILTKTASFISKNDDQVDKNQFQISLPEDTKLEEDIDLYIKALPDGSFIKWGKNDLSRVFYDIAVLSSNNEYKALTSNLLTAAVDLNPRLSFWSVELANYYLLNDQSDASKSILNTCMKMEESKKHCQDYMENNVLKSNPLPVGFLKDEINNFYINKEDR